VNITRMIINMAMRRLRKAEIDQLRELKSILTHFDARRGEWVCRPVLVPRADIKEGE